MNQVKLFHQAIIIFSFILSSSLLLPAGSHGLVQLKNFISERPEAKIIKTLQGSREINLDSDPFLFISDLFELDEKVFIYWDPTPPNKDLNYISDHVIPTDTQRGKIRIRRKYIDQNGIIRKAGFESLWYALIFELYNSQNYDEFTKLYHQCVNGFMTKDDWIKKNVMLEYKALKRLNKFHVTHWKPWLESLGAIQISPVWGIDKNQKFQDWFDDVRKNGRYRYWDNYYDKYIAD